MTPITIRAQTFKLSIKGFSLIEMAIVLFIVALLLGGLLPVVSSQIDHKNRNETRKQLDEVQQALIGYAVINGRLPCPASSASSGLESFCTTSPGACGAEIYSPAVPPTHGRCFKPYDGFVPAATLGITPVDSQGFMIDGWSNRIRYAVATKVTLPNIFTFTATPSVMNSVGMANLVGDLYVCARSPDPLNPSLPAINCDPIPPNIILTNTATAVIYSTGTNGGSGGSGTDELANANSFPNPTASPNSYDDNVFVSHEQTATFDDLFVWISPNILINRMVTAGKLP